MRQHTCKCIPSYYNIVPLTSPRATSQLINALIAADGVSCEIYEGIGLEGKEIDDKDEEHLTN